MIFLDTSYINGLLIKNDTFSVNSSNIEPFLESESKATNITVLVEVLNSLNRYNFFGDIGQLISSIVNLNIFDCLSAEDYREATVLYRYYGGLSTFLIVQYCSQCRIMESLELSLLIRIFDKIKRHSKDKWI
jgi:hypothetical protein